MKKKILCFILICFVICSLVIGYFFFFNKTSIGKCSTELRDIEFINIGNNNILWDTGAKHSLFFDKFTHQFTKTKVGVTKITDYAFNTILDYLYFSSSVKLDNQIEIKNLFYNIIKETPNIQSLELDGILGMNVICKANWLIDFSNKTIQILSKNIYHLPKDNYNFYLSYKKSKSPKVSIVVQGVEIEDVLVDSGFLRGELTLFKEDIEKINHIKPPVDTTSYNSKGLYENEMDEVQYTYDSLIVNSVSINSIQIIQSEHRRLIGLSFLKRFNSIYLDTKAKRFYFYY